ncbi:unnamed protein product [Orchesella dallaii]|uniref:DOMON domain-containing protein n=1 Tax=Orchesella dallaii TaxID=48710 RepID=A0ABP1PJE8_9HEXA
MAKRSVSKVVFLRQLFLCGLFFQDILSQSQDPYRHSISLDSIHGRYRLDREVDFESKQITFNVTAQTTGYIGFGLSKNGLEQGADFVIGGVDRYGRAYFTDRYGIADDGSMPVIDPSQDWTLNGAWEKNGVTFLSFSRPFDTCDSEHDLPISNDYLAILWAIGETDDKSMEPVEMGKYDIHLLDPDYVPDAIFDNFPPQTPSKDDFPNVFKMNSVVEMITVDTIYRCSFHKVPTTTKQHIIGYNTVFPSDFDREHVHHLLLYRCRAPPGTEADQVFSRAAESGGDVCLMEPPKIFGRQFASCGEMIHGWGYGGRALFFPEHVGIEPNQV